MKNQVKESAFHHSVAVPDGGVVSGETFLIGKRLYIAEATATEGSVNAMTAGVFDLLVAAHTTASDGDTAYYDSVSGHYTADETDMPAGYFFADVADSASVTTAPIMIFPCSASDMELSGKADKVATPTNGNFAGIDTNGNMTDSGHKHADYATASHNQADTTITLSAAITHLTATDTVHAALAEIVGRVYALEHP